MIQPVPLVCVGLVSAVLALQVQAGNWPQILGPNRNGTAPDETIGVQWPVGGPSTMWQHKVGNGFAGPAICGRVLVVHHRVGREEVVEGLDRDTGATLWETRFPADYAPSFTADDGPRAVPLIEAKRVFLYGAMGELRCLELRDGQLVWERKTFDEFVPASRRGGEPATGYFGIGSSPIVVGNRIIVNVGGSEKEAGIVVVHEFQTKKTSRRNREEEGQGKGVHVRAAAL